MQAATVGRWHELRANCWDVFSVTAQLGTWAVTSAAFAGLTVYVIGSALLHPEPKPVAPEPADVRQLRVKLATAEGQVADLQRRNGELQADNAAKTLTIDVMRRDGVFFPRREELRSGDLIPATNVPTTPEE